MKESTYLNKTFQIILERFIANGHATHYSEIAAELGVSPPDGRKLLHRLFSGPGFPGWFHPKTDTIASFAPFSNVPNNHKITIDGEHKWFGQ